MAIPAVGGGRPVDPTREQVQAPASRRDAPPPSERDRVEVPKIGDGPRPPAEFAARMAGAGPVGFPQLGPSGVPARFRESATLPSAADSLARAGRLRLKMRDLHGAKAAAARLIAAEPGNPRGHLLMTRALNIGRQFSEAEAAARKAVALGPDNPKAHQELGWAQLHQRNYEEAANTFTRGVAGWQKAGPAGVPGREPATESRAAARPPALSAREPAPERDEPPPGNTLSAAEDDARRGLAETHAQRAFAFEGLGQRGRMLQDLEAAARLDPGLFAGHLARARAGQALFDPGQADSWRLMEPLPPPGHGGAPWPLLAAGLVVALVGLAFAAWRVRARASPFQALARRKAQEPIPAPEPPPAGSPADSGLLAGQYQFLRFMAKSWTGRQWEAQDTRLGVPVAVKRLSTGRVEDPGRGRFLAEARRLAALAHPNLLAVREVLELPTGIHIVSELAAGRTAAELLASERRLGFDRAQEILLPVCEALEFVHGRGVAHRSLRPSRILLTEGGVLLTDLAASAIAAPSAEPSPYHSPEAMDGVRGPAMDVYALGICLYEFLAGAPPFAAADRQARQRLSFPRASLHVPGLPSAADVLIARALAPDPARRPSAAEFAAALRGLPAAAVSG